MYSQLTKLAAGIALVLGVTAASAVGILNEFQVNETVIPGSAGSLFATTFTADKISATYVERFQVTGANTFSTTAFFNVASFAANDGFNNVTGIGLNNSELSNAGGYRLYGTFTAIGTFATVGGVTTFSGGTATFSLFADTQSNTTAGYNADLNDLTITGLGGADDRLLAQSSVLIAGEGNFGAGLARGNFAILFGDLDEDGNIGSGLTTLGKQYFFDPSPFYAVARTSGQFDTFVLPALGNTAQFSGTLDITFNNVPEPTSLALAGMALLGLGLSRRRKTA